MSDDETFIRAIVDAPGDDLPRLVYADWLDDRDDPRGPYLREEMACVSEAKAGRYTAFPIGRQTLFAGLDPVWAARVSRPPIGVCCDQLRFDCAGTVGSGPPLVPADLDAFEREHRLTLPVAYRAFMLTRNGGYPYPSRVADDDREPEDWPTVESFYMIGPLGWREDHAARIPDPIRSVWHDPFGQFGRLLPLAGDGGLSELYLGLDGTSAGIVFRHGDPVHAWDERPVRELAGSLGHLLAQLTHTEPEWVQAIIHNDLPVLSGWLTAGGDLNAEDPESEWHPLEYAVQWGRTEMVRLLLARGATITEIAWEVVDRATDAEIKAMVKAVCPKKPVRRRGRS